MESERYVIIGDIHGCYDLLEPHLDYYGRDRSIAFVFLGDYIDRKNDIIAVIDAIRRLPKAVALMGNHEEVFLKFLQYNEHSPEENPYRAGYLSEVNGGKATLQAFGLKEDSTLNDLPSEYRQFFFNLQPYYENQYFIAVHAGIDIRISDMKKQKKRSLLWARKRWLFDRLLWEGKTVYFGHTITARYPYLLNRYGLLESKNTCGIDVGSYCTGRLASVLVEGGVRTRLLISEKTDRLRLHVFSFL